jgi:hypothetical protein
LALGTAFRFFLYRYWVFGHHRSDGLSNLARVEEAQRALFEEPPLQAAPRDAGEGGPGESDRDPDPGGVEGYSVPPRNQGG